MGLYNILEIVHSETWTDKFCNIFALELKISNGNEKYITEAAAALYVRKPYYGITIKYYITHVTAKGVQHLVINLITLET